MFGSWKRPLPKPADDGSSPKRRTAAVPPLKDYDGTSSFKSSSEPASSAPAEAAKPEFSRVRSIVSTQSLRKLVSAAAAAPESPSTPPAGSPGKAGPATSGEKRAQQAAASSRESNKGSGSGSERGGSTATSAAGGLADGTANATANANATFNANATTNTNATTNATANGATNTAAGTSTSESGNSTSAKPPSDSTQPGSAPASDSAERAAGDGGLWSILRMDRRPAVVDEDAAKGRGRAWAFWARGGTAEKEPQGRIAVSGTETEHEPRQAKIEVPRAAAAKPRKSTRPSVVVPDFATLPKPSRAARLANLFWASTVSKTQMVQQGPAKPRKALVIGVHGYFPSRMSRAILGEPTGTSIKFANEAEARLNAWFTAHYPGEEIKIDKVALEGEGKIEHRVDRLYGLLLNWENLLREADFIFFAVHSQGAVVTLNIVARLLRQQQVSKKQRISILSMAGSLLGPMPGMDQTLVMKAISRIEHDSLLELFRLQDVNSPLSRSLQDSLRTVLAAGVKVILVGSADDQLIPLYSALAVNIHHPNLFRAVYIDGDDVMPDVVSPLLQLAAQQLNAGGSDHGVISELSSILAGALTSKGHSKLYNSDTVYDLGLKVALETGVPSTAAISLDEEFKIPSPSGNPYLLPWAANTLVSTSRRSRELAPVINDLLAQFNAWKPETKQMRDLKHRLVGIGRISKL